MTPPDKALEEAARAISWHFIPLRGVGEFKIPEDGTGEYEAYERVPWDEAKPAERAKSISTARAAIDAYTASMKEAGFALVLRALPAKKGEG
jgi:hypothetical protein